MPATESTWRNTQQLHRIFAISGVVLTIGTVWMFWKDHAREWKNYQVKVNSVDLRMNELRQKQYQTSDAVLEHEQRAKELSAAKARPADEAALGDFKEHGTQVQQVLQKWRSAGYPYSLVTVNSDYIDKGAAELVKLSADAQAKRAVADTAEASLGKALADPKTSSNDLKKLEDQARATDREATAAEQQPASVRGELVNYMQKIVSEARRREDEALGIRKFKSANIDAAKANVDIAIRDNLPAQVLEAREKDVLKLQGNMANPEEDAKAGKDTFAALNLVYQTIAEQRKALEKSVKRITADVDAAQKRFDESRAGLEQLKKQEQDRKETYFTLSWQYPWFLGKKFLALPILDAFGSPRKIDNLWSDGLTQNYNFSYVRRFDRCTTCHQSLVKSLPGQATAPAYVHEEPLEIIVTPPPKEAAPKARVDENGKTIEPGIEEWLGLRLAGEGLITPDDVTVALVLPKTPAAKAQIASKLPSSQQANGLAIRQAMAQAVSPPGSGENLYPLIPGLVVGDVIEGINDQPFKTTGGDRSSRAIAARLVSLAQEGKPIRLMIRRGLPNPYISHPRLDLYLSDASPHRMQTFACTICHDGQGSATDFKWASHTPSTVRDMQRWTDEHGWFDNAHWIYPMYAKRFTESACLKCHHDVVELEPSEKYADAPAPKVTHGYHLIRKYGCYGCHEVNGFDGPARRIGPDLRSEPNYFAVAQQIHTELLSGGQSDDWKKQAVSFAEHLAAHPEDNATRNTLKTTIEEQVTTGSDATALDKSLASLANMLKDVETPGTLRRAGPSLRYLNKKVDQVFLYDWINNPRHFRDTTRMPRFFGMWDHLRGPDGMMADHAAPKLEPIEIRGTIAYFQSYANAQKFEPEPRPTGIDSWTEEQRIARGKVQFQTRGCLACHNHKDFPDVQKYRNSEEIVQGPDLSGVGEKFAKDRNPNGPDWLYSWIKNPTKYHVRTLMPVLFLDPDKDLGADLNSPNDDKWFDPADDIVTYLLTASKTGWQPVPAATAASQPLAEDDSDLKVLMLEHLNEAFFKDAAEQYYLHGIPPELEGDLKGAEKDLIVQPGQRLTNSQRLKYIGRKTIAKYGCFGCHDIPGFEDAKPIGTGLADWGRKDPARLAFEHITHYALGHGHGTHAAEEKSGKTTEAGAMYADSKAKSHEADPTKAKSKEEHGAASEAASHAASGQEHENEDLREFYSHALEAGNRIGFIYQKLKEPRSYDYDKTENKKYNERLRMPQFGFTAEEREAVITFVLGLVADPPQPKYIFKAKDQNAALIAGRQVLEKFNCGGCHILGLEKWKISYAPGEIGQRTEPPSYSFLRVHFGPQQLTAAATPNKRNELHSTIVGLPPTDKADGLPVVQDTDGLNLEGDSPYAQRELKYLLEIYQPALVEGNVFVTGQAPVSVPVGQIDERYPTWGGVLTKYLLPEVTKIEKQSNPNASGAEAYGWLPPPLTNEGSKVQTAWLHDFLLDPYPIRPAVFLRMPRFNMSSSEATILANYFAAADGAEFPYAYSSGRDRSRLAMQEANYVKQSRGAQPVAGSAPGSSARAGATEAPAGMQRLDDAMKIVVNGNFCVKCHLVADFTPAGSNRAKAPNLAEIYRRLRPDYVREWIANPKMILPYTSMPVNIPFENPPAVLSQLYHGTNEDQIAALTDLLMNYDQYARQSTRIADRVQPVPAEGAVPATGGTTGGTRSN